MFKEIDGIALLNEVQHYTYGWGISVPVIVLACIFVAGLGIFILACRKSIAIMACVGGIMLILGFLFGLLVASSANKTFAYNSYEVTIDEGVDAKEFLDTYEVIEQRGIIYEIKEKDLEEGAESNEQE